MNCVSCKEPMIVLDVEDVEVDYCPACRGTWLDSGELEILLQDKEEVELFLKRLTAASEKGKSKRKCPICGRKMVMANVGRGKTIFLDYCSQNHGIWFDRRELQDVLQVFDVDKDNKVVALLQKMFF